MVTAGSADEGGCFRPQSASRSRAAPVPELIPDLREGLGPPAPSPLPSAAPVERGSPSAGSTTTLHHRSVSPLRSQLLHPTTAVPDSSARVTRSHHYFHSPLKLPAEQGDDSAQLSGTLPGKHRPPETSPAPRDTASSRPPSSP